jgi:hypothetical protein
MAKPHPLNRATLPQWQERLVRVRAGSVRRFGKLSPAAMLRHLRCTIELVTGDFDPGVDLSNVLTRTALFRNVFLAIPWPKGRVKAPDWITPAAEGDVDEERVMLFAAMEKFVAMVERDPAALTRHVVLGPVSMEYNSRLQGKHINHHCIQFGV